jgi:hypothetical protein
VKPMPEYVEGWDEGGDSNDPRGPFDLERQCDLSANFLTPPIQLIGLVDLELSKPFQVDVLRRRLDFPL